MKDLTDHVALVTGASRGLGHGIALVLAERGADIVVNYRSAEAEADSVVEAVTAAVGDEVDVLIEGHGRFNIPTAIRVGRALESFNVLWFEEPIPSDSVRGLAEVKNRIRVPIAAGERLCS